MDTDSRTCRRSQVPQPDYHIRQARPDEVPVVLRLIDGRAAWLRTEKSTTQWNRPWPDPESRYKRVYERVVNGLTWLMFDGFRPIATVTLQPFGHPELWTEEERAVEAVYLHQLVIDRDYAGTGLGAELISWAAAKGRDLQQGASVLRIDVWTDNTELHAYYRRQGFAYVATRATEDATPSGALFERPIDAPGPPVHRIIEVWTSPKRTGPSR
ncbi:GNAT family N-acetyltransferase [Actinomadura sp. NPDC048394]|uniref:GNAT family N-acetyltransferase n=1 Tax=Actinomadura sp. NPDC048394 TaxID=3158223 RepID=UPI0033F539C8